MEWDNDRPAEQTLLIELNQRKEDAVAGSSLSSFDIGIGFEHIASLRQR